MEKNTNLSNGDYVLQREIFWNNNREIIDEIKVSVMNHILTLNDTKNSIDSRIKTVFYDKLNKNYTQVGIGNNISSQLYKIKTYKQTPFKVITVLPKI